MGRGLLLLAFVLGSGAEPYAAYSSAKIPHYDYEDAPLDSAVAPSYDYRDNSPDAAAPFDYKYEEDSRDIFNKQSSTSKEIEDFEPWSFKKSRKKEVEDLEPNTNKDTIESRKRKFRPRLRNRSGDRGVEIETRRPIRYRESQKDSEKFDKSSSHVENKNDILSKQNRLDFQDDRKIFPQKTTTFRVIRRKARDRGIIRRQSDDVEDDIHQFEKQFDNPPRRQNLRNEMERTPLSGGAPDVLDVLDDTEDQPSLQHTGLRQPPNFEALSIPSSDVDELERPLIRHPAGTQKEDDTQEVPQENRRILFKGISHENNDPEKQKEIQKNYNDYNDYYDMRRVMNIKKKLPGLIRREKARLSPTTPREKWKAGREDKMKTTQEPITPATSTTTKPTTTRYATSLQASMEPEDEDEDSQSMAEKSRLSILKKAMRKESIKNDTTNKPPVLMQVTDRMQTVVVVEPPVQKDPWMRAQTIVDDTPENLEQVKKMMRHKLVQNSKSIHDLTDNWDELVCDYVDTSLLKNSVARMPYSQIVMSVIFVVLEHVLFCVLFSIY